MAKGTFCRFQYQYKYISVIITNNSFVSLYAASKMNMLNWMKRSPTLKNLMHRGQKN